MKDLENDHMWDFVHQYRHVSPTGLMLKYGGRELPFDLRDAITQIDCRRRTASKLPSFVEKERFCFPSKIAAEQSSNEAVARYHASIVPKGSSVADLTAGLGIDAICIAASASSVDAYEMDADKCAALCHNIEVMAIDNLVVMPPGDSIKALRDNGKSYDIIFIDPARRDDSDRRLYGFSDCTPDVKALLPFLMTRCKALIIKASPMLDLIQTIRDLPSLTELKAVSWRGECKEVLAVVKDGYAGDCKMSAVMIDSTGEVSEYMPAGECHEEYELSDELVGTFLYEPDPAVLKLGSHANLCGCYSEMAKCDTNTQLYISPIIHDDFPGRILKITAAMSLNDKQLKGLKGSQRNVVCRNFPMTPEALRKRLKLKDGGSEYVYGLTINGRHRILDATRLK